MNERIIAIGIATENIRVADYVVIITDTHGNVTVRRAVADDVAEQD